jgi:hypothetical protein
MNFNNLKIADAGPTGSKIKKFIFQDDDCIVYIDECDEILYAAKQGPLHEAFGGIQNRISYWESICNSLFSDKETYDYKCLLAEGYARILHQKNKDTANDIINLTKERIIKHGQEILKQAYILAASCCTLFLVLIIIGLIVFKQCLMPPLNHDSYEIALTTLFGGIGAYVFATLR